MISRRRINIHWSKRLSCQLALALIFGILLAMRGCWQMFLLAVTLAIAVLLPLLYRRQYLECALRGALFVVAGALGAGCYIRQTDRWEMEKQELLQGQEICLCGTLICKEQKNEGWQLTLGLSGYENRVIVSAEDGGYPLDCVLSVKGPVMEFNSPRNEGQFNEKQFYKSKKTVARMYAEEIVCLRAPSGVCAWREWLYRLRMRVSTVYENCLPEREAGILATMAVGEKAFLDADVRAMFQNAGIIHILAISGMHISMIGLCVYRLLRRCRRSYVSCALVTAGVLLLYGMMIGTGVSANRAIGMFLIYLLAQCLGRRYDTASALAVLAALMLMDNPFLLQNVSFQFSFVAVCAVITAGQILPEKKNAGRWSRWLQSVCMAMFLQLFTLPLVAYYYYEVPVYALFLNLLLLPYLGVVLGCGLIGGCVGSLADISVVGTFLLSCARVLLLPCRMVLSVFVWVCQAVETLPFSTVICGKPSAGKLWVYYGLLVGLVLALEYMKKQQKDYSLGTGPCVTKLAVGAAFLLALLLHVPKGGFEIDYLDVGQGDGSMLRTEEGVVCFVDGGSTDVSSVGNYRILPFLKSKGIRKVDYWILSHLDDDHVNGFYEVLASGYPVDAVVISAQLPENEEKLRLLETLVQYEVQVVAVRGGDVLQLHNNAKEFSDAPHSSETVSGVADRKVEGKHGASLQFLSPDMTTPVYDCNGASLVCLYEDAQVRALWTGDIGVDQEKWMLKSGRLQKIDIYKAAHHGSKYSNSEEYLKALSPKLSVISCGKNNRYGHPDAEAIAHMEETGSRILYTMYSGQIKVRCSEETPVAELFLSQSDKTPTFISGE